MSVALGNVAAAIGIRGFIAIGFAIALGVVKWRADAISADPDEWQQKAIQSELRLTV